MKCSEIEPLIYLVREGELTPGEKKELDRHLAVCENCSRLHQSVVKMTNRIGKSDFSRNVNFSGKEIAERVADRIDRSGNDHSYGNKKSGLIPFIKVVAASLLLIMASTFGIQEAGFQKSMSALQDRVRETAVLSGNVETDTDCVNKLKRKYNSRKSSLFPPADEFTFHKVNEEQLAQYLRQVCGPDAGDINAVKNMLKQAGLLKNNGVN
ncbi:MAG TPA: anti-sigma factor [Bacteroidales bacterium]|nr:anti-sigma factor [Bacteroidales bacterium]